MEKSVYSSNQQFSNGGSLPSFPSAAAEESGWTAYFDDLSDNDDSFATSSLLSDAASHAACKFSAAAETLPAAADRLKIPRKLTLKPKAQFFVDAALEDTASSPDNSPKVADLEPFDENNYRRKSSLGNVKNRRDQERNLDKGFEIKATEYTNLRKRGLCLVPMSMFANYID